MPTDQANNAADTPLPSDARDGEDAATVVRNEGETVPGGGGLMRGDAASERRTRSGAATGGTAPNAPIDVAVPQSTRDGGMNPSADAEARDQAADATSREPLPTSR